MLTATKTLECVPASLECLVDPVMNALQDTLAFHLLVVEVCTAAHVIINLLSLYLQLFIYPVTCDIKQ